jgi:hypothetical protein
MPSPDHHRIVDAASVPASARASVPESEVGTRLSFPSRDPGREVFQPNVVVGLCHGRPPLRAPGPRPVDRWTSRAPPRCSPRLYIHINAALFMATRIAFMAYSLSLTGMRRHPCLGAIDLALRYTRPLGRLAILSPVATKPRRSTQSRAHVTVNGSVTSCRISSLRPLRRWSAYRLCRWHRSPIPDCRMRASIKLVISFGSSL